MVQAQQCPLATSDDKTMSSVSLQFNNTDAKIFDIEHDSDTDDFFYTGYIYNSDFSELC